MDMRKKDDSFIVCLCAKMSKADVMAFIKENEIKDLKELQEKSNLGKRCGGCREDLEQLIEMVWE